MMRKKRRGKRKRKCNQLFGAKGEAGKASSLPLWSKTEKNTDKIAIQSITFPGVRE